MVGSSLLPPVSRRARHVVARGVHALRRGERELPTYFIVGAKRAGTTSVDEYLVDHPLVMRGLVEKGCRYYDVNYERGPAWFRRHLPLVADVDALERRLGQRPIVGESSPYYCYHPEAPARIARDVPDARLVMVVRDPVERAWSHYQYERARGFEELEPLQALAAEPARLAQEDEQARWFAHRHFSYVGRSRYAEQLRRLHAHFPADQVLVVQSEHVFADPAAALAPVLRHLGLPPHVQEHYGVHKPSPVSSGVPVGVPDDFRAAVAAGIADDLAALPSLLDVRPSWA